jgi:hypothetical protein
MLTMSETYEHSYRSYLLRVWIEDHRSESPWRIVLINTQTGDRRGFADFKRFVDFLQAEIPGKEDHR